MTKAHQEFGSDFDPVSEVETIVQRVARVTRCPQAILLEREGAMLKVVACFGFEGGSLPMGSLPEVGDWCEYSDLKREECKWVRYWLNLDSPVRFLGHVVLEGGRQSLVVVDWNPRRLKPWQWEVTRFLAHQIEVVNRLQRLREREFGLRSRLKESLGEPTGKGATLGEAIESLVLALNTIGDGLIVLDSEFCFQFVNREGEEIIRKTRGQLLGTSLWDQFPEIIGTPFAETYHRARETGEAQTCEGYNARYEHWIEMRVIPADNGYVVWFQDVSARRQEEEERRKLEEQLIRAQRMESIGTLAGGVAHDLNNLLAPITMGIELLKQEVGESGMHGVIEAMERSAGRGAELVRQVLSFSRGVSGSRGALDLKHVLKEVQGIMESTFPRNIDLQIEVERSLDLVLADSTQMSQVLLNLCVNARDAMPDGGVLQLKVRCLDRMDGLGGESHGRRFVELVVSDTGVGIEPENLSRIFDPFYTTKEEGKGTGIGLSTVQGIVESHGGCISVTSVVGEGTTFVVALPAIVAVACDEGEEVGGIPEVEPCAQALLSRGECLLLVDDEASVLTITGQALRDAGYEVLVAEDGAQAIGVYAKNRERIRLIITDVMMPVMDGFALVNAIRRMDSDVKVIATSGVGAGDQVARFEELGVREFLPKPYSRAQLFDRVREALGEAG